MPDEHQPSETVSGPDDFPGGDPAWAEPVVVDPERTPYGVIVAGSCMPGKFGIEESKLDAVDVLVLLLQFTPYDRLTAEPASIVLVLDPADAESFIGSIKEAQAEIASAANPEEGATHE